MCGAGGPQCPLDSVAARYSHAILAPLMKDGTRLYADRESVARNRLKSLSVLTQDEEATDKSVIVTLQGREAMWLRGWIKSAAVRQRVTKV